jgi:hypothetical protein
MLGPVLLLAGNTTAEVQLSERAANSSSGDFNVEACGTWNGLPGKSTAVETPFINTPLNFYEGFVIEFLFPSASFIVVRMEGLGIKIARLAKDLVALRVTDFVESEDVLLSSKPTCSK